MSALLNKFSALGLADIWSLGVAYRYLLEAGWRLFVRRERLDRWVVSSESNEPAEANPQLTARELALVSRRARWFNAAARYPFNWARCLQRSLGLCLWMERKGLHPELKLGVRMEGSELEAHAWVERAGVVLNDAPYVRQGFVALKGANPGRARRWI